MLRITSRKDGLDPVVIALIREMVRLGGLAWAVKGTAAPERIKLFRSCQSASQEREKRLYLCVNWKPDGAE